MIKNEKVEAIKSFLVGALALAALFAVSGICAFVTIKFHCVAIPILAVVIMLGVSAWALGSLIRDRL